MFFNNEFILILFNQMKVKQNICNHAVPSTCMPQSHSYSISAFIYFCMIQVSRTLLVIVAIATECKYYLCMVGILQLLGDDSILQFTLDSYTFFAPTDAAMDFLIRRRDQDFFSDVENVLSFIK